MSIHKVRTSICWLRRDLRLSDNNALYQATTTSDKVYIVFIYDEHILSKLHHPEDKRLSFISGSIEDIQSRLKPQNQSIIALHGKPEQIIPSIAKEWNVDAVFVNKDYEPYAYQRDHSVKKELKNLNISFYAFKDHVIFEEKEILTDSHQPYGVYTPYSKKWKKLFHKDLIKNYDPDLSKVSIPPEYSIMNNIDIEQIGFKKTDLYLQPGTEGGEKKISDFIENLENYHLTRNFPSLNQTSQLSLHLRFGTLSIRRLMREALAKTPSDGAESWINELIWRDFYQMILANYPHIISQSYKDAFRHINWCGKTSHLEAWKKGDTGYPIVDAAMRCLNSTGWIHNRLRMICASFLCKDLLIDWREGEKYFADKLLDYDLAANNGGWQWCASTGVDAQPYFRIFNPLLQSKKFDPNGLFIKSWCYELKSLPEKYIHEPNTTPLLIQQESGCIIGKTYPEPIINHQVQKIKYLQMLKS